MRFGIIYYGTEAKDRGLDQLAQCLMAAGHQAFIVTRKSKNRKRVAEFNGVKVIQMPMGDSRFMHLMTLPLPINWMWKQWVISLSRDLGWHGVFSRETPLAWPIICAARDLGIPAFLDMRENLSAMYKSGRSERPVNSVLKPSWLVRLYESRVMTRFHKIFTVSDELNQWVQSAYRVPSSRISTFCNYPSRPFLDLVEKARLSRNGKKANGIIRLIHTGYIRRNRGLQDVLRALRIVNQTDIKVVLRIVGEGTYLKPLKALARQLSSEKYVEFIDMLPPHRVPEALADSDIGVCSYLLNEQAHQTLPGKLFEYMSVGLPVLSSARKSVTRIIKEVDCGRIYKSRDPKKLASAIFDMISDQTRLKEMGINGREAILSRYNWKTNVDVLQQALERCAGLGNERTSLMTKSMYG